MSHQFPVPLPSRIQKVTHEEGAAAAEEEEAAAAEVELATTGAAAEEEEAAPPDRQEESPEPATKMFWTYPTWLLASETYQSRKTRQSRVERG
jgi:hypothetical protein